MNNEDLIKLKNYLKQNNIQLSEKLINEISQSNLKPEYFEILKESEEVIRLFIHPYPNRFKLHFIKREKDNFPFDIFKQIIESYSWDDDTMRYIHFVVASKSIKDLEILKRIIQQDTWEKMKELDTAYRKLKNINKMEYFETIASKKTLNEMVQLNLACENEAILNDQEIFEIIAGQDTWEKMLELILACEHERILHNRQFFYLIANQESHEKMGELVEAYLDSNFIINGGNLMEMANLESAEEIRAYRWKYMPKEELEQQANASFPSSLNDIDLDNNEKSKIKR